MQNKKEELSISKHLELLSFSELINETSHLIKAMNDPACDLSLELKSKLTVRELGQRLRGQYSNSADKDRLESLTPIN